MEALVGGKKEQLIKDIIPLRFGDYTKIILMILQKKMGVGFLNDFRNLVVDRLLLGEDGMADISVTLPMGY
ncbi:hypothetical protein D3C81_1913320 [compost metagenome]